MERGWQVGGGGGDEQELGRHQHQVFFLSHPLMLLLARLFLQALIPRDSSNTNQTRLLCNAHIKDSLLRASQLVRPCQHQTSSLIP